jgi:hypothetical protein
MFGGCNLSWQIGFGSAAFRTSLEGIKSLGHAFLCVLNVRRVNGNCQAWKCHQQSLQWWQLSGCKRHGSVNIRGVINLGKG